MAQNSQAAQASTNYKEAFALFDKRGNGRVTLDSLGDLLRACGQNPTLAEIGDLEKTAGGDCAFLLSPYQRKYTLAHTALVPPLAHAHTETLRRQH